MWKGLLLESLVPITTQTHAIRTSIVMYVCRLPQLFFQLYSLHRASTHSPLLQPALILSITISSRVEKRFCDENSYSVWKKERFWCSFLAVANLYSHFWAQQYNDNMDFSLQIFHAKQQNKWCNDSQVLCCLNTWSGAKRSYSFLWFQKKKKLDSSVLRITILEVLLQSICSSPMDIRSNSPLQTAQNPWKKNRWHFREFHLKRI